jgi:hypothetical protein
MARRKILPGIVVVHDSEGVSFHCDGEPIEDMEFSWEDLEDSDLVNEVAEELVEYIDGDEIEDIENPVATVMRELKRLHREYGAQKGGEEEFAAEAEEEEEEEEDDDGSFEE